MLFNFAKIWPLEVGRSTRGCLLNYKFAQLTCTENISTTPLWQNMIAKATCNIWPAICFIRLTCTETISTTPPLAIHSQQPIFSNSAISILRLKCTERSCQCACRHVLFKITCKQDQEVFLSFINIIIIIIYNFLSFRNSLEFLMYAGVYKCQKLETFSEGKPLWVFFRQNVKSLTFDPPIPPPSISTGIVQTRAVICEGVFYGTQVSLGSDLWVLMSVRQSQTFADLIDVTLADEDINSIPNNDVNGAILGYVAIQAAPSGGRNWNWCIWHHLVAKLEVEKKLGKSWEKVGKS